MERDLGEQPISKVMQELGLDAHALVMVSDEHLTHKMVARARKGRWLTPNVRSKIVRAMTAASGRSFTASDLFNYR